MSAGVAVPGVSKMPTCPTVSMAKVTFSPHAARAKRPSGVMVMLRSIEIDLLCIRVGDAGGRTQVESIWRQSIDQRRYQLLNDSAAIANRLARQCPRGNVVPLG